MIFDQQILAILQEAGEDSLLAICRTIDRSDRPEHLRQIIVSIRRLLAASLVLLAAKRDPLSREWIELDIVECNDRMEFLLLEIESWKGVTRFSELWDISVLATKLGTKAADAVLKKFGNNILQSE